MKESPLRDGSKSDEDIEKAKQDLFKETFKRTGQRVTADDHVGVLGGECLLRIF